MHVSGKRIPQGNPTERVQLYKHSAFTRSMIFLNENRALALGVAVLNNCFRMEQKSAAAGAEMEERPSIGKLQLNS
jgi:hypothetical protein